MDNLHNLIQLKAVTKPNAQVDVFFVQNAEKKATAVAQKAPNIVTATLNGGQFKGAPKTFCFIRQPESGQHTFLVGVGQKKDLTTEKFRQMGALAWTRIQPESVDSLSICFEEVTKLFAAKAESALAAFLEGFLMAGYKFEKHKTKAPEAPSLKTIEVICKTAAISKKVQAVLHKVTVFVDSIFLTRDFSNEPSNFGTPEYYANECVKLSKKYGLKVKVLSEADCRKEKMELFLSVGEGSDRESKVVVLEYHPKKATKRTLALVGKGVTFDSGGISLKPGARMEDMKHDMTGAAVMIGATVAAARLGSKSKIVTVVAFAENMPSGNATQPGNVIRTRSGKTVEIINTDAEGRLVLADALDYAQDWNPDLMINAATLTGACSVALGKFCSAAFVTDDSAWKHLKNASEKTDERLWQLPLFDEYLEDMKSHTADLQNSANDSNGGTIRGAIFMKQFIRDGQSWAHLDIANTAYDLGVYPYNPRKGCSGSYVRLLTQLALDF